MLLLISQTPRTLYAFAWRLLMMQLRSSLTFGFQFAGSLTAKGVSTCQTKLNTLAVMDGLQNIQTEKETGKAGNEKEPGETCEETQGVIIMETSKPITYIMAVMALMIMISGGLLFRLVEQLPKDMTTLKVEFAEERTKREALEAVVTLVSADVQVNTINQISTDKAVGILATNFANIDEKLNWIVQRWTDFNTPSHDDH
jgi:hypothetical protein